MKNRMREICTSGSVRGGGGDIPTYSAALMADRQKMAQEGAPISEWRKAAEEGKPAGVVERDQSGEEQTTEQLAEDAHRQEELWSRGDPALSIECDATARYDHVHMGMVGQCRSPGVEHGGDADPCAQWRGSAAIVSIVSAAAWNSRS